MITKKVPFSKHLDSLLFGPEAFYQSTRSSCEPIGKETSFIFPLELYASRSKNETRVTTMCKQHLRIRLRVCKRIVLRGRQLLLL